MAIGSLERMAARRRVGGRDRRQGRRQCGFTLVELLVVLAILALIATVVTPQVMKYLGKAETDTARLQVNRLGGILDLYRIELGSYPGDDMGLTALVEQPPGVDRWNGPYVQKPEQLKDPWGRPYQYRYPGEHGDYDLYSLGKDGQEGGDGDNQDITSW